MAALKDLVSAHHDENFRKGACHAGHWLLETAETLAAQGRSASEIKDRAAE